MAIPAASFVGFFSISDLTSGLTPQANFPESATTSKLHHRRYSGTLSGEAFFAGIPVASTVANNSLYTYP